MMPKSDPTSPLLIHEPPLQVQPSLAAKVGLNEAIVLQQVHYWIRHYRKAEEALPLSQRRHFKQGRWWVYNSYAQWRASNFSFWSESTIKRAFKSLERQGLLISSQLAEDRHDRTSWYAIDYQRLKALDGKSGMGGPADETGDPMHEVNLTPSRGSERPNAPAQVEPMIKGINTETTQRVEVEVNDGCAIGDAAPVPLVIAPDLAEAAALFERTGRELSADVLARFEQMAARCDGAARAAGDSGGLWLTQALNLALGKARPESVLNYADKVIDGWLQRGYRVRRRAATDGDDLSPELEIFREATGRLPLPDQRPRVISLIHQHRFSSADLHPFWEAWVGRDKRRSDLTWLTDWAVSGVIPSPGARKKSTHSKGRSGSAVESYLRKHAGG